MYITVCYYIFFQEVHGQSYNDKSKVGLTKSVTFHQFYYSCPFYKGNYIEWALSVCVSVCLCVRLFVCVSVQSLVSVLRPMRLYFNG